MKHTSFIVFTSILGIIDITSLSTPLVGQELPPDGSVVVSPRNTNDTCLDQADDGIDDSNRIQSAILNARSTVFFKAGCYRLKHSLVLRSGLTYMGESDFDFGSVLKQTARDQKSGLGLPIFTVDGTVFSVTIIGLTFFGTTGVDARGIVASDPSSVLVSSTLRDNFFLAELSDCIDTPMVSTRVERNEFGLNGSLSPKHRHIHSTLYTGLRPLPTAGDNWIVGNLFRCAPGALQQSCAMNSLSNAGVNESIYFESGGPLHIIGNDFENNDSKTTLRVHSTSQVIIHGNWFEANSGVSQITFLNVGNVQLEDNFYSMRACQGNCFLFDFDQGNSPTGITRVFMGYETGLAFDSTELATKTGLSLLTITGPLCLNKYAGTQPHLDCHIYGPQ
jgi:hypothetical protein